MTVAYVILGFIAGGFIAGSGSNFLMGALGGAVIGLLLNRVRNMDGRIQSLESAALTQRREESGQWGQKKEPELPEQRPGPSAEPASQASQTTSGEAVPSKPLATPSNWQKPWPDRAPAGPSLLQIGLKKASAWMTTGNVPVKIGVLVTFIGISFLLKYAIDRELLVIPIEFRLLAVAGVGLVLVVTGWRLRAKTRVYAVSLQGGGAGILFLTIFAAFRIWQLLPGPLAFFALLALTFFTGALAVLQNSRSLAILGMTGGFLAPVLTSTGQGSHVALFSYYLVLNGAILGISWFRAWRGLNLLGFVFTFLIGSLWGYQYYKPELRASIMPFLVLHFLFYQAIAILYALRQPPERLGMVDGTLVFGTPAVVFALQSELMKGTEYGLAISAAAAAVFYALTAKFLYRNQGEYLRLLTESFAALAVAFATITIPLALDARWTSAAWALEGAALVWVGMRQQRHLANLAGVALVLLSGISFMEYGWKSGRGLPVFNGNVLGGVLISLSAFFASRKLRAFADLQFERLYHLTGIALFVWGALWWLGSGFMEIMDRPTRFDESHILVIFLALSFADAAWIARVRQWSMMRNATFVFLPLLLLPATIGWIRDQHFLFGLGWLAWPLAWFAQAYVLKLLDRQKVQAGAWHFCTLLAFTLMVVLEAYWWTDQSVSEVWAGTVAVTVMGIVALMVWRLRNRPVWPVPVHPASYLNASIFLVAAQVIILAGLSITGPGDPDPLAYVPVLNPFDLAMLFAMVVALLSLAAIRREAGLNEGVVLVHYLPPYRLMLAVLFFLMTTSALVRGVHHYTAVPWDGDALMGSVIVQTSLSIYWGLLGFAGMIWGARSMRRPVWLAGTGFMALVVIKLFLVDLGNTGTVERIVSFMGIGALLLVVGYFAPVPPRQIQNELTGEKSFDDEHTMADGEGSEA